MTTAETTPKRAPKRRPAGAGVAAGDSEGVKQHNAAMDANGKPDALAKDLAADQEGLEALEPGGNAAAFVNNLRSPLEGILPELEDDEEQVEEEAELSWLDKQKERFGPQEPKLEPHRWMIGCPPEHGGREGKTFEVYVQSPLGWMGRSRFFSIMTAAMARAIKASGGNVGGLADVFGPEGGSLRDRAQALSSRDWGDAASFMSLIMELSAYVPDLLGECYCIWLEIPAKRGDRDWAKQIFEQRWDPSRGLYGLTDEQHEDLIERFIDQNYEELRGFFTRTLPRLAARVAQREKERVDRESMSAQSKQSSTSGHMEAVTS